MSQLTIKQLNKNIQAIRIINDDMTLMNEMISTITVNTDRGLSSGSGFIVQLSDGITTYIITATHTLLNNDNSLGEVYVGYGVGTEHKIKKVSNNEIYYSIEWDIAIIKLTGNNTLSFRQKFISIPFINNDNIKIGGTIIVISNPLNADIFSFTVGYVRDNKYLYLDAPNHYECITIDAATTQGSSGATIFYIDENNKPFIGGILQFGFANGSVPLESFGGGASSNSIELMMDVMLQSTPGKEFKLPNLKIPFFPISTTWIVSNFAFFEEINYTQLAGYVINNQTSVSAFPNTVVVTKVNGYSVGAQLGGHNILYLLLKSYYNNKNGNITFTFSNNQTLIIPVNDLFGSSNNNTQQSSFIFNNKRHFLL